MANSSLTLQSDKNPVNGHRPSCYFAGGGLVYYFSQKRYVNCRWKRFPYGCPWQYCRGGIGRKGIEVNPGDAVRPALNSEVYDNSVIVVGRKQKGKFLMERKKTAFMTMFSP